MLWFYVSALAVLVGAELNAEIEHASPYGKDPGEKVPGEKKKIGAVAERAWDEQQAAGTLRPAIAARQLRRRRRPLPPASAARPRRAAERLDHRRRWFWRKSARIAYAKLRSRFAPGPPPSGARTRGLRRAKSSGEKSTRAGLAVGRLPVE